MSAQISVSLVVASALLQAAIRLVCLILSHSHQLRLCIMSLTGLSGIEMWVFFPFSSYLFK